MKHFSGEDIFALDPRTVADSMAEALAMVSRGDAVAPIRSHIDLGEGAGTFLISGVLTEFDLLTVKVINVRPENAARSMPRLQGALTAFRSSTGEPLATLDARAVTEVRTAACSAVSLRRMARPDSSVLVIFGSGPQATAHRCALSAEHDFGEIRVVRRADDHHAALEHADVVVTATNSAIPVFPAEAIRPGTHVICVGSGSPNAAEVEPELLARAAVIRVDHRPTCLAESGEIVRALRSGLIDESEVRELGEVLLGRAAGRVEAGDITVYKSVGNGTQDAALAAVLLGVTART